MISTFQHLLIIALGAISVSAQDSRLTAGQLVKRSPVINRNLEAFRAEAMGQHEGPFDYGMTGETSHEGDGEYQYDDGHHFQDVEEYVMPREERVQHDIRALQINPEFLEMYPIPKKGSKEKIEEMRIGKMISNIAKGKECLFPELKDDANKYVEQYIENVSKIQQIFADSQLEIDAPEVPEWCYTMSDIIASAKRALQAHDRLCSWYRRMTSYES